MHLSDHADIKYGMLPGLNLVARKFAGQDILLVLDGAPPIVLPDLAALPAALRARAQPEGKSVDEIREKIFKNYALKSIDAVRAKLKETILYMERKPEIVKSIASFPYILKSP